MIDFSNYNSYIDPAYLGNPIIKYDSLYKEDIEKTGLSNVEVIYLNINIKKNWNRFMKCNVQFCIIVVSDEDVVEPLNSIFDYDFNNIIKEIKQSKEKKSANIFIDKNGFIIKEEYLNQKIDTNYPTFISKNRCTVGFFLSYNGVDLFVNGIMLESDNHINSYKDMVSGKVFRVYDYKNLLNNFYIEEVEYDPLKCFFAYPNQVCKEHRRKISKKSLLLFAAPEERFQARLVKYLRSNCVDLVLEEVMNNSNDRYDVWILTDERELFIIEIKWVGKSINADGNISYDYNNEKRFFDGYFQIKDYIDNTEKYCSLNIDTKIYMGILLMFDAREDDNSIPPIPDEFTNYSNVDLTSQHYILKKDKVNASENYATLVKQRKNNKIIVKKEGAT